jgi:hypothetical protein
LETLTEEDIGDGRLETDIGIFDEVHPCFREPKLVEEFIT